MPTSIQVDEIPEVLDLDSFHLRLAVDELTANIVRRVGDIALTDRALYRKIISEAIDMAQGLDSPWYIAREFYLKGLRYIDMGNLVPLPHPKIDGLHRVPVKVTKEKYRVFVGKKSTRLFTGETIPPDILAKIVMATSASKHYELDKDMYEYDLYVCKGGEDMSDVAWRASESMYIVVLTDAELTALKGGKE